jgi:hypothetical protein
MMVWMSVFPAVSVSSARWETPVPAPGLWITTAPRSTGTRRHEAPPSADTDTTSERTRPFAAAPCAEGQDPDQRAFTAIGDLLAETWAPPKVAAALYRAAAKIPGVTVVHAADDATGREGIAVVRTAHGEQTQWIFDPATYAFLGERTVLAKTGDAGPAGTVVGASAVLTRATADRAGELPAA